mmetsp:Transcript_62513/g.111381  ORF Transcript_62513/g.111381 Transcript_62513/m.111381 type:complete len:87 (+) Transcript_62513:360-620(+)
MYPSVITRLPMTSNEDVLGPSSSIVSAERLPSTTHLHLHASPFFLVLTHDCAPLLLCSLRHVRSRPILLSRGSNRFGPHNPGPGLG